MLGRFGPKARRNVTGKLSGRPYSAVVGGGTVVRRNRSGPPPAARAGVAAASGHGCHRAKPRPEGGRGTMHRPTGPPGAGGGPATTAIETGRGRSGGTPGAGRAKPWGHRNAGETGDGGGPASGPTGAHATTRGWRQPKRAATAASAASERSERAHHPRRHQSRERSRVISHRVGVTVGSFFPLPSTGALAERRSGGG